jgi:D-alanine-D-alanine ligase
MSSAHGHDTRGHGGAIDAAAKAEFARVAGAARVGRVAVLVLGGGPDAEREVSLVSSTQIAAACRRAGFVTRREVIDRLDAGGLRTLIAQVRDDAGSQRVDVVVFPALHGGWGEGGPLQDLLQDASTTLGGVGFVGCGPKAARLAMDKLATKVIASRLGVPTAVGGALNPRDDAPPIALPVVIKPVHEGSSVGVRFARTMDEYAAAVASVKAEVAAHPYRAYMVEEAIVGARELTVGLLWTGGDSGPGELVPLAPIEIVPKAAFYDYEAKYISDATRYIVRPPLDPGIQAQMTAAAKAIGDAMGVRHLARVDFLVGRGEPGAEPRDERAMLLEVNTMPGFTEHSLLPMAAADAGLSLAALCARVVGAASRDIA